MSSIYKDVDFVDFMKSLENYAYLQGLDQGDVSRMRSDIMIAFVSGMNVEESFDAIFNVVEE